MKRNNIIRRVSRQIEAQQKAVGNRINLSELGFLLTTVYLTYQLKEPTLFDIAWLSLMWLLVIMQNVVWLLSFNSKVKE